MEQDSERVTITVEEAGQRLGISRGLAYEMARTGRIPALRLGDPSRGRLVIPMVAFERMLATAGLGDPEEVAEAVAGVKVREATRGVRAVRDALKVR